MSERPSGSRKRDKPDSGSSPWEDVSRPAPDADLQQQQQGYAVPSTASSVQPDVSGPSEGNDEPKPKKIKKESDAASASGPPTTNRIVDWQKDVISTQPPTRSTPVTTTRPAAATTSSALAADPSMPKEPMATLPRKSRKLTAEEADEFLKTDQLPSGPAFAPTLSRRPGRRTGLSNPGRQQPPHKSKRGMSSLVEEGVKVAETALLEDSYVKMAAPTKTAGIGTAEVANTSNTDPATATQIEKDAELAAALQESFVAVDAEPELSSDEAKKRAPGGVAGFVPVNPYRKDDKHNPETLPPPLAYTAPTAGPATRLRKRKEAQPTQEAAKRQSGHKEEAALQAQAQAEDEAKAKAEAGDEQMEKSRHISFTESTHLQHSQPEPSHLSPMVTRTRGGIGPQTRNRLHYKDPEYWYGPRISRKREEDQDPDPSGG